MDVELGNVVDVIVRLGRDPRVAVEEGVGGACVLVKDGVNVVDTEMLEVADGV